ncbi:MAG: DUF6462 family protein [Clostridia bacterium]|nr:DUF6462 family protein [Clostridia bacterium]
MNKGTKRNIDGTIVTLNQACERVNLGTATVTKLAKDCGAWLKIGKSVRIDAIKLEDYVKTFQG